MKRVSPKSEGARRGAILICVLACALVASTLAATTLQAAMRWRRESRLPFVRQQTEWLLEAGVARAANALASNNEYDGESWVLPDHVLGMPAVVTIQRSDKEGELQGSEWVVVARLNVNGNDAFASQLTHRFSVVHSSE